MINDSDKALDLLKKYSYYSIINTYKDVFKDFDGNYKGKVSFEEIYSLYDFDKNIRGIFLKYILEIEITIKSLLAELISSKYGIKNYLVYANCDQTISEDIINNSISKINEEINKQNNKHEAVTHYLNIYGFVPPFVLMKILSLGEISRLYTVLKQNDRQAISREFGISDKVLKQIVQNMTMIRNICAHNDRLFSFHSKFLISFKYIEKDYLNKGKSTNLYMIMKSMQCLLDKENSSKFEKSIKIEISKLFDNIDSIDVNIILYLMGFPTDN